MSQTTSSLPTEYVGSDPTLVAFDILAFVLVEFNFDFCNVDTA